MEEKTEQDGSRSTPHDSAAETPECRCAPAGGEDLAEFDGSELLALLKVSDAIAATEDLDQLLPEIVELSARLTGAESAAIGLLGDATLDFKVQIGLPNGWSRKIPLSSGITGWVARHNRSQNVGNVLKDQRFLKPFPTSSARSELAVPVSDGGTVLGVIDALSSRQDAFSRHHEYFLEELGKRTARAIFEARRVERLRRFQAIDAKLSERILNVDEILQSVLESAVAETGAEVGTFWMLKGSALVVRQELRLQRTAIAPALDISGTGLAAKALRERTALNVDDVRDPTWSPLYVELVGGMRSELAVPIFSGDYCVGVLDLESTKVGAFTNLHLQSVSLLAQRASATLRLAGQIQALQRVSQAAAQVKRATLPEVIDTIYAGVRELFPETGSAIFLRSDSDPDVLQYSPGGAPRSGGQWPKVRTIQVGHGILGRAVQTRSTVVETNISRVATGRDSVTLAPGTKTSVAFPLVNPQEELIGAFTIESPLSNAFTPLDIHTLEILAGFASTALSNHLFITELEGTLHALEVASQQTVANASLAVLGEITGNLVHRIGNDIGLAHEEIKDLLQRHRTTSATRRGLLIAKRSTGETLRLVSHLLNRISDTSKLTIETMCLRDAVMDGVLEYGRLPTNIRLAVRIRPAGATVRSTRVLPLIVEELLRNAVKAIGKENGVIRISSTRRRDTVVLAVWNSGTQIPEEHKPFIFDFLYHRRSRSGGGLGFGLWWARSVLRAQGGDIVLSSTPHRSGTQFEIILRRGKDHES